MEAENGEEMEELSAVPGAVSEPRGALLMCGNTCREKKKNFKFFQIADVVTAGGAAHTVNWCKQCYKVR